MFILYSIFLLNELHYIINHHNLIIIKSENTIVKFIKYIKMKIET